ncbi:MAG: ECF transporter S component [Lachnospiraceae bacterium]|nr:ECF transporter S component [Lachnospiraceae bacterium]
MNKKLKNLVYAAVCLALCLVLPFLTGQIPEIGKRLSPMHIPVFLCGFVCGWPWGLAVGFIAPLLRSVLFGMPALYPDAVCMAFELASYGAVSGLLYRLLPRKPVNIYLTLIVSMILGRLVWGAAKWLLLGLAGKAFTLEMFLAGAVLNAVPGIILHIVLIPVLIMALEKAGVIDRH